MIYNEHKQYRTAWPYPESHEDMVAIAKKKKDHEMTDSEFNTKYAAFRHEIFRLSLFNKRVLLLFNIILHYIELYLFYGGPKKLSNYIKIKKPIFIIGDFRSGTSVLERLISHHPNVIYFTMQHSVIWSGPYLWSFFLNYMGFIREDLLGHKAWMRPKTNRGFYWPHSSNVLLHRGRPFETENLWEFCKSHLKTNRNYNWDTLNDKNSIDNNTNFDLLTEELSDSKFESLFLNSIKLLLANAMSRNKSIKNPRFILKNPLNGFRIRYIYKLFPDAKFIHISRNPIKTTLSQLRMAESNLRCFFLKELPSRKANTRPLPEKSTNSWNYILNNQYPNDIMPAQWFPRLYPRTFPEYYEINNYIKSGKLSCAAATAVIQHEKVVINTWEYLRKQEENPIIDNVNLLTIWHEDILKNAKAVFKDVMNYLELETTEKERISYLELEDFPNGMANVKRVKQSNKNEKYVKFDAFSAFDETQEVYKILENGSAMKRYLNRVKKYDSIQENNQ